MHVTAPDMLLYVPIGHIFTEFAIHIVPFGHDTQAAIFVIVSAYVNNPMGHAIQTTVPVVLAYVFLGHAIHAVAPGTLLYVPIAHGIAALLLQNCPTGHAVQFRSVILVQLVV
jgi:hypothetical protein